MSYLDEMKAEHPGLMAEQETYVDFQEAVYKRLSERGMDIEQLGRQIYIKPQQLRLALQDADYLTWPLFWEVCTALEIKVKIELSGCRREV